MRWIGILDENGEVIEEGACPDNCDFTTALGRPPRQGERYIEGKGETEEMAKYDAKLSYPTEI